MTPTAPFFSERLLVTAPDGTYGGLRRRRRVSAYDDRLQIGDTTIDYRYLADLRVYGNVLHVAYVAPDGKQIEEFFKHDTFLERTGVTALSEMAARIGVARGMANHGTQPSRGVPDLDVLKAEQLEPATNGWQRIAVYSALVAFPAVCPVCALPADAIGRLDASAGLNEKGAWLVPVCVAHRNAFTAHLGVVNWRANRSRLEFNIWNREYAQLFLALNRGDDSAAVRDLLQSSPLLFDIKNGARFVQFQYAVSVLFISFLIPSAVERLRPDESAIRRGLKFSLLSLLTGWWAIPAGPVFTITCIVRNCRGGIDVTGAVGAVVTGSATSAGGYR